MYYTQSGQKIRNAEAYAGTGAPVFKGKYGERDINTPTTIYKLNLKNGKKYVGKTVDIDRRMNQHFSGNGSKVTKKFKPVDGKTIDEVPGFFSDDVEQYHTKEYMNKYGYENVRGGSYTNSKTLHKSGSYGGKTYQKTKYCKCCGRSGHTQSSCYANTHVNGCSMDNEDDY